jgi:hypothetical protein
VTEVPNVAGFGLAVTAVVVEGLPYLTLSAEAPGTVGYAKLDFEEF